jgi:hypothetical protein
MPASMRRGSVATLTNAGNIFNDGNALSTLSGAATVVNSGTISGVTEAVQLAAGYANR